VSSRINPTRTDEMHTRCTRNRPLRALTPRSSGSCVLLQATLALSQTCRHPQFLRRHPDPNEFILSMCLPPPFLSQGFALYFHECQPQQILPLLPARQGDHTIARPDISLASSCSALGFSGLDLGFEDLGFQWVCVKCRGAIQSEGLGWCSSFPVLCIRGSGQPFIPRQEKFSIQIPSIRESFTIQIPDCRESFSSQIPDYRTTRDLPMACRCEQAAC
jgi:hypothetical protein